MLLALAVGACGGGAALEDGPTLAEEMAAGGVECEDAGFASEGGETGSSTITDVEPLDVGGCSVLDEPVSIEVFSEGDMDQVRDDAETAAADGQDALAVGSNWIVLGDPPEVQEVAEATGADFLE